MARRYWVIAPYDSTKSQIFDKAWEYDLQNGTIAVGWSSLGDISNLSRPELELKFEQTYGKRDNRDINTLWRFYHEVSVGDVIIARRGRKKIGSMGTVTGTAFYDKDKGKERIANLTDDPYPNFIHVEWDRKAIDFDKMVFSFYTMYETTEEKYKFLLEGVTDEEEPISEESQEFALERYLEDFIVTNFDGIFQGQLTLYRDPEGNIGQQYPTDVVGRIDILAKEPSNNSFVVIELKKGRESDVVVGQILRYIGWVKEELCEEGQTVRGLIICKEEDDKLKYALKPVQDLIKVKFYKVDFHLVD
jgi:restriction system protein